jgi:hypothetical protein
METTESNQQNDTKPLKKVMIKLLQWLIGMAVIMLIPFVFPIAALLAVFYYIPVTIGGWIYNWIAKFI